MKLTRKTVLEKWGADWRTLRSWNRDLSEVTVEVSDREHPNRLGTCWSHEQRLVVYKGDSIHGELDTLLHEFAHAATIGDGHGLAWQGVYAAAIEEVTGVPIPRAVNNYQLLCWSGKKAVKSWWVNSGHDFLWRMCK